MTRNILIMFLVLVVIAAGLGLLRLPPEKLTSPLKSSASPNNPSCLPPAVGPPPLSRFMSHPTQKVSCTALRSHTTARGAQRTLTDHSASLICPLSASLSSIPLAPASDLRDVFLLGNDTAVVDTSAAFADSHPSGVLAEELTIASIVATLNANNPQIVRVKILVDGKERETLAGHADLRRFYTASEIDPFVKDASEPSSHRRIRLGRWRTHRASRHERAVSGALLLLRRHGPPALRHQIGRDGRSVRHRCCAFSRISEHRPAGDRL